MANPFEARFNFECANCADEVEKGEAVYAHNNKFVCHTCADLLKIMCTCENYKKPEYPECLDCSQRLEKLGIPF